MDGWHIALYAFAVYLAIRTLVQLMKAHEQNFRRKLAQEQTLAAQKPESKPAEARASR